MVPFPLPNWPNFLTKWDQKEGKIWLKIKVDFDNKIVRLHITADILKPTQVTDSTDKWLWSQN